MRLDMVEMERLLGMAEFNVKQMAMLLGDFLQNSSGKQYGVNCWRILEMGSCSPLVLFLTGAIELLLSQRGASAKRYTIPCSCDLCPFLNRLCSSLIPFHQKLRQHLMMRAMGLTRPAQQLEILYIMPMLGNANGTAVGMTPLAHLAICNVCSDFGCLDSDILATMDAAVEDGMVQRNEGPYNGSLSNEAPWILTPNSPPYISLVYTGSHGSESAAFCAPESLFDIDFRDKIVLCEGGGGTARSDKGQTVKDAGDAAMILMSDKEG
ncbi:hypothetical protein DKX38_000842 [Salix brachista]|uniref:PA domain-containing protein n=1 Tax=Salix brachista TaxID=2182728 RepID=A0A5N5P3B9_9ROSI|nr:hypothetical protein DKX38_000842 [Salix brachista]